MKAAEWEKILNDIYEFVIDDDDYKAMFMSLLGRGYFPRQLPPPFETKSFEQKAAKHHKLLSEAIIKNTFKKYAELYRYSLARPSQLRRILSLPNPSFHFLLSLALTKYYQTLELDYLLTAPNYSMSFPVYQSNEKNRAFEFSHDWDALPARRLEERAKGRYIVTADISRFFPSIYTHSIPWAIHGKSTAKSQKNNYDLEGNVIDLLARNMQDGQTLGIPIGPDTSFIISESILNKINIEIQKKIKNKAIQCFHRADDYEFVTLTRKDADFCLATLQEALSEYELELNTLKTSIKELPQPLQDPEVAQLRGFNLGEEPSKTILFEYYDLAFNCYRAHPKGTLNYAIKRIPTKNYFDDSIVHFMAQSILLEPGVIESVFVWLAKAECIDEIDKKVLTNSLKQVIKEHSVLGHTSEVAWAVWGFLLLNEPIPKKTSEQICSMSDSVVLLLALDARKKGLLTNDDLTAKVKTYMNKESLYGANWLLAYEAVVQNWVTSSNKEHVTNDPIFSLFKEKKISFYNSQNIASYQEIMKNWQPYNLYTDEEDEEEEELETTPF